MLTEQEKELMEKIYLIKKVNEEYNERRVHYISQQSRKFRLHVLLTESVSARN